MTTPSPKLTKAGFAKAFASLLKEIGTPDVLDVPPYIPPFEIERCDRIYNYLAPRGYSDDQVAKAISLVLSEHQYPGYPRGLESRIVEKIEQSRPQQIYSVDPAVGDPMPGLPPVDPDAIAMLQGKPTQDAVPNLPVTEVLLTFVDWPLNDLQGTPKLKHPNHLEHLSEKSIVKIWLPAHRHCQQWGDSKGTGLPAHQRPCWWKLLNDHFLQHGNFDGIFGDRKIFDGVGRALAPKMQSIPITKPSATVATTQAVDPFEEILSA